MLVIWRTIDVISLLNISLSTHYQILLDSVTRIRPIPFLLTYLLFFLDQKYFRLLGNGNTGIYIDMIESCVIKKHDGEVGPIKIIMFYVTEKNNKIKNLVYLIFTCEVSQHQHADSWQLQ